jgi:hypothetical protein
MITHFIVTVKSHQIATSFLLQWLEETFLPYLDQWEECVHRRDPKQFTTSQKKRMLLSQETMDGIRMTSMFSSCMLSGCIPMMLMKISAKSFVGLVRYLFTVPGVKYFLSRNICQDPLEKFFGCQRQVGGTHNNPTVLEFQRNTQTLRVVDTFCRGVAKGNCRGNKRTHSEDFDVENCPPLPKRSKSRENPMVK